MEEKKVYKINKTDWAKIETTLSAELDSRKTSQFRKYHETIWKEVDRQIQMEPLTAVNRDGSSPNPDWHDVFELGEISKASEVISADVRRIVFPQQRFWFEAHSEVKFPFDPDSGKRKTMSKEQKDIDGRVRAFMVQQHVDFGLKDRTDLSIKEALHHGSFVAEVRYEEMDMIYEGSKVKTVGAPVWYPHSMWNCYPDPSPSVIGTNMFYTGSMFVEEFMPRHKAEKLVKNGGEGWMTSQWKKVPKDEQDNGKNRTKDVKLSKYWGDITLDRSDGNMFYPNHFVVLMNGVIVCMKPFDLPYSPIIYRGYERQDVRDPYYTSPIIKQSPMHKMATILANQYINGVKLRLEPPIVYDGNDPDFVTNGGPIVAPGSKTSTKGANSWSAIEIGDPQIALEGLQFALMEIKDGLGKPGTPLGDRATAAEVTKNSQDSEVGIVGFIDKFELALRTYLYMQHEINKTELDTYSYYNPEMGNPDFMRVNRKDIPESVHFEVVGAKGILGEEQRSQKTQVWTAFCAGNPLFAPLLDPEEIVKNGYQDAGNKNPERFLKDEEKNKIPPEVRQQVEQMAQLLQQTQAELQKEKEGNAVKSNKIQADFQTKMAAIEQKAQQHEMDIKADHQNQMIAVNTKLAELATSYKQHDEKLQLEKFSAAIASIELMQKQMENITGKLDNPEARGAKPQEIHVHMPGTGKKIIKTPDGRQYTSEDAPLQ